MVSDDRRSLPEVGERRGSDLEQLGWFEKARWPLYCSPVNVRREETWWLSYCTSPAEVREDAEVVGRV